MILDKIVASTKIRLEAVKEKKSPEQVKKEALALERDSEFPFEKALRTPGMSFICEVKKASPSRGLIAECFPYLDIAREYERIGAAAISVLTEPDYFLGSDQYLKEIVQEVQIPVLRKDFIIDEYQIYEAKILGASAVLLICAILDADTLKRYLTLAHSLGLSALVETHSREEVEKALGSGAKIIGVNNRNLNDFHVTLDTTRELRRLIPADRICISESGIHTEADMELLRGEAVDGVLIGESLMRSENKEALIRKFRG